MYPVFRPAPSTLAAWSASLFCLGFALQTLGPPPLRAIEKSGGNVVRVRLSEWQVTLDPEKIPPGPVVFEVTNSGTVPHALEVEGERIEKSTETIQPGARASLKLDLRAGVYEAYCPVGKDSHKMLGMLNHLKVGAAKGAAAPEHAGKGRTTENAHVTAGKATENNENKEEEEYSTAKTMRIIGGGPVIQILPGPFPFAKEASAVIESRPADQQEDLTHKAHMGPYSNNVAKISGEISLVAVDRGKSGDSVSGVAEVVAQDGAHWKVVMDRVQTQDVPFNPRFGGVIMGLFYHGSSGVHTPLVPTIQSSLALWAFAHLYRNGQLITDDARVHVMLLSRTRRPADWALDCWDCSTRPIEELQLQVTAAPNAPPFDTPGGFLFINWEKSPHPVAAS